MKHRCKFTKYPRHDETGTESPGQRYLESNPTLLTAQRTLTIFEEDPSKQGLLEFLTYDFLKHRTPETN